MSNDQNDVWCKADRVSSTESCQRVDIDMALQDVIVRNRLNWYGHVMHQGIKSLNCEVLQFKVSGKRPK